MNGTNNGKSSSVKSKVRYKTLTYNVQMEWLEDRAGEIRADGRPSFRVASPPEFKGEHGVWTPEDLFVAAVETCTMTTFMAFAQHKKLPLVSYRSRAVGVLNFLEDGYSFTEIFLRPEVVVESEEDVELAKQVLQDAHRKCLISKSIKAEVILEPTFRANSSSRNASDRDD